MQSLPQVLAENPALLRAVKSTQLQLKHRARVAPTEKRAGIKREADLLRAAIAQARLIRVKGGAQ